MTADVYLRDVIVMPESVHAGDFKVELTGGFTDATARVDEYVVTDQLRQAFRKALTIVRKAVRDGTSEAAYLHGSFGSGKSHFLTVLHAVLNNHPAARAKAGLQPVIAEHDEWLRDKKFLMIPYHLVGAADVDSALLGGYVDEVKRLHPGAATPPVYRADAMLDDARRQRAFLADDAKFAEWLGAAATPATDDEDDLPVLGGAQVSTWTTAELDRAFSAPAGDPVRDALVTALLSGPMSSYVRGATGDTRAFIPLENGLSVISRHAKELGYHGLILFLDELILWLQAHMADQQFVNDQVSKLVKLIESGVADRPLPIVSFISRQRDLTKLVGEDVTGADVKNLEAQVQYLAGRFDVVELEDGNLPAIIKERVLKPRPGKEHLLAEAFAAIESSKADVRDVLLDSEGATGADWNDFRAVYPLSPALLNVLVALCGALQRERTGLKLLQEMLYRRRDDMKLGELIPLGDLWDVLADGAVDAFTDRLRREAEAAHRFHLKARNYLAEKYGGTENDRFRADDRSVKTLLLASLAPTLPALARLTGARLAALNHGSIRSRTVPPGDVVTSRLRELQAEFVELRAEGEENPVFSLHLSDLDIEPLLDAVGEVDRVGERRRWVKQRLWEALGVEDSGAYVCEREIVWRGTRRTAEFVFDNVREAPTEQFSPLVEGNIRFVLDYPFDTLNHYPTDDAQRVAQLRRDGLEAPTIVWLPHFLSSQKINQLGRLIKIEYLLDRDRIDEHASDRSADVRAQLKHQLKAHRATLREQLTAALRQAYGIAGRDDAALGAQVGEEGHVLSLLPGHKPRLHGGAEFEYNLYALADGLFAARYPKHPDLDPGNSRKAVTKAELKIVYGWISRAAETGGRVVVDKGQLALVRRIVHPLELGEVHDGPLTLGTEWRRRIEQHAAQRGTTGDFAVEDIREWLGELDYRGLDKAVSNLLIASYALLADRTWLYHGVSSDPPDLDRIGPGWSLREPDKPTEDEFTAARERAAAIFGIAAPNALLARNVQRLAADVRANCTELESAVLEVHRALDRRGAALGIDPGADRVISARCAASLLARLTSTSEATPLVRELAAAHYEVSDQELAAAIKSAPGVLAALGGVDWQLLETVRQLCDRGDDLGERAQQLVDEVARAAGAHEFRERLAPVLAGIRDRAVSLIAEVGRRAPGPSTPAVPQPAPVPTPPQRPQPADRAATLPAVSVEPRPAKVAPAAGATMRVRRIGGSPVEAVISEQLAELQAAIQTFVEQNPGKQIEVRWELVADGDSR